MKNNTNLSRRAFLGASTAAVIASCLRPLSADDSTPPAKSRIVRVHSDKATRPWDYTANYPWNHTVEAGRADAVEKTKERYFDYINDDVVASMLDRGLRELTDTASAADAWRKLLPNFSKEHTFAIKMNMNNASFDEKITTNRMDQTMPLVNAILDDLVNGLGVSAEQITLIDALRWFHPVIVKGRCKFPGVKWVDQKSNVWDKNESVTFTKDQPGPDRNKQPGNFWMPMAYTQSNHIINLCIMKKHGCAITGAMKSHFGAIPSPSSLHEKMANGSLIGDLCNTPSIKNKVRINIGDALFANWQNNVWAPRPWKTFPQESPNSLFFGTDPVAIDSVMLDHIIEEVKAQGDAKLLETCKEHNFLEYAMTDLKLGFHEHKPYDKIDYREIEA